MASEENLGFSAGNNAAIRRSQGDWVLLLNPDTVVPEDTFEKVLAHAESGGASGRLACRCMTGRASGFRRASAACPPRGLLFAD